MDVKMTDSGRTRLRRRRHHAGREVRSRRRWTACRSSCSATACSTSRAPYFGKHSTQAAEGLDAGRAGARRTCTSYLLKHGTQVHRSRVHARITTGSSAIWRKRCTSTRSTWTRATACSRRPIPKCRRPSSDAEGAGAGRERQEGASAQRDGRARRVRVAASRVAMLRIEFEPHTADHRPRCRRPVLPPDGPQGPRPGRVRRGPRQRNSRRRTRRSPRASSSPAVRAASTTPAAPRSIPAIFELRPAGARHLLRPAAHGAPAGRRGAQGRTRASTASPRSNWTTRPTRCSPDSPARSRSG